MPLPHPTVEAVGIADTDEYFLFCWFKSNCLERFVVKLSSFHSEIRHHILQISIER